MQKIAIMGTHGVGKSTLSYKLAAYYKSKGKNVDLIQERIRFSPFPFNEKMQESTALWAYHSQVVRELESEAKGFDVAICDRSAMDCFFYAAHWDKATSLIMKLWQAVIVDWMRRYSLLIYVSPDIPLKADGIRSEDVAFQKNIDKVIYRYITKRLENGDNTSIIKSSDIFSHNLDIEKLLNAKI